MKKRNLVIICVVLIIILITLGTLYAIDMDRMKNNKQVVFSTWGHDYYPIENEIPKKDFELIFNQYDDSQIRTIILEDETEKFDYNIYSYDGDVKVKIDNKEYNLRDALLNDKITMDKIIEKANKDSQEEKVRSDMFSDGGTMIYKYDTYTIIKFNTLDNNKDIYIGNTSMDYDVYKSRKALEEPEDAIHFSSSSFYIDNIEEFNNLDLKYDANQEIYSFDRLLEQEDYKNIAQKLGIVTVNEMTEERLKDRVIILVFQKSNKGKLSLKRFKIAEEKPTLFLERKNEDYGNAINGFVFTFTGEREQEFQINLQ